MFKAAFVWLVVVVSLAYFHRPEFVPVAVAGIAIFMVLGVTRVEAMSKLTATHVANVWHRIRLATVRWVKVRSVQKRADAVTSEKVDCSDFEYEEMVARGRRLQLEAEKHRLQDEHRAVH
ncbi:MAG: hypothetical protein KA515_02790 [Candidatus Pacebacteria bacterium]|nr:hypothetical protein [Candidatus Paceibacterota bacterium]